MIKLYSQP